MKDLQFDKFPTKDEALRAASCAKEIASSGQESVWFRIAMTGEPVLVRTVFGKPSYWIVPLHQNDKVSGFVRVMQDGNVSAIGRFGDNLENQNDLPATVTGIKNEEAMLRANELIVKGETVSEPMFVHDGPPGREAWLITTFIAGKTARWIFVTPGFTYERLAGELLDTSIE